MSKRLSRATALMIEHGVTGYRFSSSGVLSTISVPFKLKMFAADVKRKTAAYDRMGFTCNERFLRSSEVALTGGDYVEVDNNILLVGKLTPERSVVSGRPDFSQYLTELLLCNVKCNITNTVTTTNVDTGKTSSVTTALYSNVYCSMVTAEIFYSEPMNQPKDDYFIRLPSQLTVPIGADFEILDYITDLDRFKLSKYNVKYHEIDTLGYDTVRVGGSVNAS